MTKQCCGEECIGVEVLGRYDGISHWQCPECRKRYSRVSHKELADNELCRYGKIYKVSEDGQYRFTVLSERDD